MSSAHYPGRRRPTPAAAVASSACRGAAGCALAAITAFSSTAVQAQTDDPIAAFASLQPPTSPLDSMAASNVLIRAISLIGTPYRWGGNTPESGFDCSGLVAYVFRDMLDLRLPRNSRELAAWHDGARDVELAALRSGDLVFFGSGGGISHVGIYVGDGRFVHAPSSGGTVRLDRMDGAYWQARYAGAKRVLPES